MTNRAIVTGCNGVVGQPLMERLRSHGWQLTCVSRTSNGAADCLQWDMNQKLNAEQTESLAAIPWLIHCAPIWLLKEHLEPLVGCGVRHIIAFSSTSITAKSDSSSEAEKRLVSQLMLGEKALCESSKKGDFDLTIFRCSMIYGYRRDQNVAKIARFVRRFGFFPVVRPGTGLRQPVNADDLVSVSMTVLQQKPSGHNIYVLAGAEAIPYCEMVKRIFVALDKKPRILFIPLWLYRLLLRAVSLLSSFQYTAEMADRMNNNLHYDIGAARKELGFAPEGFQPRTGVDV